MERPVASISHVEQADGVQTSRDQEEQGGSVQRCQKLVE